MREARRNILVSIALREGGFFEQIETISPTKILFPVGIFPKDTWASEMPIFREEVHRAVGACGPSEALSIASCFMLERHV